MRAAFALRIFSGMIILIFRVCRTLRSAPNAIFTRGAAMVKGRSELQMQLTVTTPPVKRGIQKSPQAFLNPEKMIPLSMRKATRRAFLIVVLSDEL